MAVSVPPSAFAPDQATARNGTATVRSVNYEVVHHVDGRIRMSIPRLGHDAKFAERLVDSVSALPGVTQARVNRGSSSLVVIYDAKRMQARASGRAAAQEFVSRLLVCVRSAARADAVRDMASAVQTSPTAHAAFSLPLPRVDYVRQLSLPALGLGLSAALTAGLALPAAFVGAVVAAATLPHALRAVQGLRTEKRLTVEVLDVTAVALLLAQSSFLAPAVMMAVIESAEVMRTWTARRGGRPQLDAVLPGVQGARVEREREQACVHPADVVPGEVVWLAPANGSWWTGSSWMGTH